MSHDYAGSLNLHSRKKPVSTRKEGDLKGGIKRDELSAKSQLIFDALNNKNEQGVATDAILDANEMQSFWDMLRTAAKDDTLGGREASRLLKDLGLKELKKEDLYAFINELYGESEDIDTSLVDDAGTIIINYKEDEDGNTVQERVHTDHTSEVETTDSENTVTTQFLTADNHLSKLTVVKENNDSETTTFTDEHGNVVLDNENNSVPQHMSRVINNNGAQTTADIDYENGQPASAVIVEGTKTSNYVYQEGKPVLASTVENLGKDLQRTTKFEWTENGHVEHITEPNRTIDKTVVNFPTNDNQVVPLTTQEVIKQGTTTTTNNYDYQNSIKYENIVEENGNQTQNIYGIVPNEGESGVNYVKLQQTKVVDGKQYQVQYDGQGNTCGIIVQFGENPAKIAQKFGCTVEELFAANPELVHGKGRNRYFNIGEEIKIPKELEADARVLQGRDSREVAIAKYQRYQAEQERKKQLRAMGWDGTDYRQGETIEYGGKKYTILGRKTNRERFLVQDSQGRIYTASHDNLILKDSYVATTDYYDFNPDRRITMKDGSQVVKAPENIKTDEEGNKYVEIRGYRFPASCGNGVNGHRDKYERDVVIDYNGNFGVASGTIDLNHNQGRYILDPDYLSASDQVVAGTANKRNCYGVDGVQAVTVNGKTFYFNGVNQQDGNVVEAQIAENISADIIDAADGPGTDNEKLEGAVSSILTPSIKARVDVGIRAHGDSDWTDVETLIYDESNGETYYRQMNRLVKSGAYTETERASQVATMLDHELHGGLGITRNGCVREILTTIDTPERRQAVDNAMASMNRYSGLQTYEGSTVLAAIRDDGFDAEETDRWGAQLIGQKAYKEAVLKLDANGQPMRDNHGNLLYEDAGEQQYINNMVGRLCFDYDNEESLHAGLEAINTTNLELDGPGATYLFFLDRCAVENAKRGYKSHYTDQDAGQIYLAGRSNNGGDVDVEQLTACDNLLFNDGIPLRVQAELSLYDAKKGNMSSVFKNNMEPEVYGEIERIIANGDIPNCTSVQDAYNQAISSAKGNDKIEIKANAIISGKVNFSQKEIEDFCIELMHSIDQNQGKGASTGHSASLTNTADYQLQQLQAILFAHPEVIDKVKERVQNDTFISNTTHTTYASPGCQPSTTTISKDNKNTYLSLLNNTKCVVDDAIFYDSNGQRITDPAEIARLTQQNTQALDNLRRYVACLEREFRKSVDNEGTLSDMANASSTYSGIGTDRTDVANKYREAKLLLRQMEAAAQGKLRDAQGNVISAQDLARSVEDIDLYQVNADYQFSQGNWKMGIILAPVIAVTTVVSGGAAAASWGAGATALAAGGATFATEYGLSMLELSTSETGNTAEARWNALEQAVIDGGSVVVGAKFMSLAQTIKLANPAIQGILRLTTVVAADVGMGAAGEYLISGEVTVNGVVMNAIFSATGNLIGYRSLNHNADPHAPNLLDQSSPSVLDVATVDGTTLSGGKFNPEKFGTAVTEVQSSVANGLTPEQHVHLLNEASLHQSSGAGASAQGKTFTHIVEDGTGVFIGGKHGDIDINAETNIAKLQEFRQEVAGWNDPNRDIDRILAMIDGRIEHLNAHPELIGTPVQSQVLDLYNAQLVQQTDALLAPTGKNGKNFKIGESDTSLIIQRINKTNSLEDLDAILEGIEHRRLGGTKQSLIDDMLKAVDSRKLQLRPEIDMDDFNTLISTKNSTGKGLNEGEIFDVVRLIENSSDEQFAQIEIAINSNSKIKKQTQIKNALNARKAKVGETPANTVTHVDEPTVTPHDEPTSNVSHASDDPATGLHTDEAPIESSPVHTDETPSVVRTSEEIRQSVSQDIDVIDTEIPSIHKSDWTKIKNELHDLQSSLKNGVKNLGARCESVLQDLKNLASTLSPGTLKTKLQKLIADFKLQLMDNGIMKPKNCTLTKTVIGADETVKTIEITYNSQGLETKRVYKNQDGTFGGEVNYTYDANNKIKTEVLKDAEGNITEHYYENGEVVKTIRKDADGNIISETTLEPTNAPVVEESVANVDIEEIIEPDPVLVDIDDVAVVEPIPPHLADDVFTSIETLNPNEIKASLTSKGIHPQEQLHNGNGAIKYIKDGVTYQMHYEDGKLTALRVKDASGNKSYYGYDSTGHRTQISRDDFLVLKNSSDAKFTSSLNGNSTPVEVVPVEPSIVNPAGVSGNNISAGVTPTNSNPKIAALIKKYRNKASHITTETFTIDGKPTEFEVLHGSKDKGSNDGYYVVNKETGDLYYAKVPNGDSQWLAEVAATKLYQAAGVDVPEISLFTANGKKGVLSKFIPDLQPLDHPHALAYDGFGMDVLLENWDSIGLEFDNTLITADGSKVIKLDNGGSFDYKAMGGKKDFTAIPMELITMVDPHLNPQASQVFGQMSRNDLISSLERAANLKDVDIDNILNQYGCPQYAETLKKRRAFIQDVVTEMKKTPQLPSESTSQYMQKVTYSSLEKTIAKATTSADLDDVIKALDIIKNPEVKTTLQSKISNKLLELNSPVSAHPVSDVVEAEPVVHGTDDIEILSVEPVEVTPLADFTNAQIGDILPANQAVVVSANAKLNLADQFEIDFNQPAMKAKLNAMKDGDILIVGREPGLDGYKIPDAFMGVSRKHLKIEKLGDQFIVTDISANGTKFAGTSTPVALGGTLVSNEDVSNLLIQNGFIADSYGNYRYILGNSTISRIKNQYGSYSNNVLNNLQKSLDAKDIKNLCVMLNAFDENTRTLLRNDIVGLLDVYHEIKYTNIFSNLSEMGPGEWETVLNVITNPPSESVIGAFYDYKGCEYLTINGGLWGKNKISSKTQKLIDTMSNYIDTQVIHSPITVKRNEPYGKLFTGIEFKKGGLFSKAQTMDEAMQQAVAHYHATGDKSLIEDIIQRVKIDLSNGIIIEPKTPVKGFMSATLAGDAPTTLGNDIGFTIDVKENSRVALLEGVNKGGGLKDETEVLFQKDSHIRIEDIKFDYKYVDPYTHKVGKWEVKCFLYN